MNVHTTDLHLDGHEPVTVAHGSGIDTLLIGTDLAGIRLVLPHTVPWQQRVAFLTKLSEAASDLADEINLRDLERAS